MMAEHTAHEGGFAARFAAVRCARGCAVRWPLAIARRRDAYEARSPARSGFAERAGWLRRLAPRTTPPCCMLLLIPLLDSS